VLAKDAHQARLRAQALDRGRRARPGRSVSCRQIAEFARRLAIFQYQAHAGAQSEVAPTGAAGECCRMRVGIDFDNTIAGYDRLFVTAARERNWVAADFCGTKRELRDAVRLLPDGEIKWQMLQGEVYGQRMPEAVPFPGVIEFFKAARKGNLELFI